MSLSLASFSLSHSSSLFLHIREASSLDECVDMYNIAIHLALKHNYVGFTCVYV